MSAVGYLPVLRRRDRRAEQQHLWFARFTGHRRVLLQN